MSEGLYIYGVVAADAQFDDPSAGDNRTPDVELVEADDLAALVSPTTGDDETAVRDSVLAHARVLERVVAQTTVIPMRFGMVSPDEDAVVDELLEPRHDELVDWLERLDGRVQMTLKVDYREEAILRELVRAHEEIRRLYEATRGRNEEATYDDRVRLGQLVHDALEERRRHDAQEIVDAVEPLVVTHSLEPPEKEFMAFSMPLLIERRRQDELESRLEDFAEERTDTMRFRLLGPMPAYDFVMWEEPAWA
jgi:Gas vesicle synthesis protein GvpL/GvpF